MIKGLWKGLVPHQVEPSTWFSIPGKLNTKNKLAHIGILPQDAVSCVLYNVDIECYNHLIYSIAYLQKSLESVAQPLGCSMGSPMLHP